MSEKHLVCKGATVYCNKSMVNNNPGTAVPLTITSQTLVVMNGGKTAATDKDCTIANMCFGNCNSGTTPPPPCAANVMWSKCYEGAEVTAAGMKFLTEESEATCMVFGGKVKIAFHGQIATPQPEEKDTVSPEIMSALVPMEPEEVEEITMEETEGVSRGVVTDVYWIDPDNEEKIYEVNEDKEVTLYLKTCGFSTGETATIKVKASEGKTFEDGSTEMSFSGKVNAERIAIIENFRLTYK